MEGGFVDLIALVERLDHVCCRYRIAAFRPTWERAGHRLEFREVPRSPLGWLRLGPELGGADGVIVQRKLLRPWQLFWLRKAAPFLAFDFDDAVFLRDSYAPKGMHSFRRHRRFIAMAGAADLVIAGNSFLADESRRRAGAKRVHVIPTCLKPETYPLAEHCRTGPEVRLVWIGSSSTLRGLESSRPLLEEVGRGCPGLSVHVVCDRFLTLQSLHVVPCPWSESGEAAALAAADIGISWVPDDLWSRGKCGLKLLQYMAAGLPVVANPVGVQEEIVRHGETGFLAETPQQWVQAISRLAGDAGLRRRMGLAGRRRVEEEYHVNIGAARWTDLLSQPQRRRKTA
jgi:glycosyltransferase involved in cell wall biosynthesis